MSYNLIEFHMGVNPAYEDIGARVFRKPLKLVLYCGPSDAEKSLEQQGADLSKTLYNNFNTRFANQSSLLSNLTQSLTPTLMAGPNQTGFSPQELAAKTTEAINTTGANYANAARALGGQLAGRGGNSGLVSGVDQQIKASLASEAAGNLSGEELGITNADYAQGRQNYQNAVSGMMALSGQENPEAFASLGTEANKNAFDEANTINQEQNQEMADIVGGVTGLASDAITFGAGAAKGGGLAGGFKALSGNFSA